MAITGGSVAHLCPTARAAFPSPSTLRQRNPLPALDDATITSPAEAEQPGMDLEVTWIMKAPRSFDGRHSWEEALSYLLGSLCEAERRTGYTIKPMRQPPPLPILGFQGPVLSLPRFLNTWGFHQVLSFLLWILHSLYLFTVLAQLTTIPHSTYSQSLFVFRPASTPASPTLPIFLKPEEFLEPHTWLLIPFTQQCLLLHPSLAPARPSFRLPILATLASNLFLTISISHLKTICNCCPLAPNTHPGWLSTSIFWATSNCPFPKSPLLSYYHRKF